MKVSKFLLVLLCAVFSHSAAKCAKGGVIRRFDKNYIKGFEESFTLKGKELTCSIPTSINGTVIIHLEQKGFSIYFDPVHDGGAQPSKYLLSNVSINTININQTGDITIVQDFSTDKIDSLIVNCIPSATVSFENLNVSNIDFIFKENDAISITNSNISHSASLEGYASTLRISGGEYSNISCIVGCKSVTLNDVSIKVSGSIKNAELVSLSHIHGKDIIDIDNVRNITLGSPGLENLNFPIYNIDIRPAQYLNYGTQIKILKELAEHFKDVPDYHEKYDVQYNQMVDSVEHNHITSFLKRNWNNYGYEPHLVFRNSALLMMFFFFFNLFLYPKILYKGYPIDEFILANAVVRKRKGFKVRMLNVAYCFIYTGFIFWGLKLSPEKIRVSRLGYSIYLIFQYLVGLVCLAYIANIIITKT